MPRKIFNFNDQKESKVIESLSEKSKLYENTISACGAMFYKIVKGDVYLLLISFADPKWNKLDDFGGQIDETDDTVMDAIEREVSEESNGQINEKKLRKLLNTNKCKTFYNKFSKYYNYVIEVDDNFFKDTSVFGDFEKTDKIKRKINWYKFSDFKNKISQRIIGNKLLVKYLEEQEYEYESSSDSSTDSSSGSSTDSSS